MTNEKPLLSPIIYDGNDRIIFSQTLIVYEKEVKIEDIAGFLISISFLIDREEKAPKIKVLQNESEDKNIQIKLINFWQQLGVVLSEKLTLLTSNDKTRKILFSLYGTSVSKDPKSLLLTVTFYERGIGEN